MKDAKTFWNKQAKNFNESENKELDKYVELGSQHLSSEHSVLDFACGTGYSTEALSHHVKEVLGIDFSEEMIKYAKERPRAKETTHYEVASIEEMAARQESYDVVVAFNVLHLVDDLDEVMKSISSILKPNGLLISGTTCLGEKKSFVTMILKILSKLGFLIKVNALSFKRLTDTINRHGFETLRSESYNETAANLYLVSRKKE